MSEDKEKKYLTAEEEKELFAAIRRARRADGLKKNYELYGIGDASAIAGYDKEIEAGEEILAKFPEYYGKLIASIVSKYNLSGPSFTECLQEAYTVLYESAKTFDPERGIRFTTYLTKMVNASLCEYLMKDGLLTETSWARRTRLKCEAAIDELHEQGIENPTDEQIAQQSGLSPQKIKEIRENSMIYVRSNDFISLNQSPDNGEEDRSLLDTLSTEDNILDDMIKKYKTDVVNKVISATFTPKEEILLRDRFGLNEENKVIARDDIAKKMGIDMSEYRSLERYVKRKLKRLKENEELRALLDE